MQTDDSAWLAELLERHSRSVRAFVFRRTPPDAVDDIVAEVFALAWRNRKRMPPDTRELAWLYRTATNQIGHHYRSLGRRRSHEARGVDAATTTDQTNTVLDRIIVLRALELLAPQDGEVLRLAYWDDLPVTDIAFVLGCTAGAARVRLHRARRHLAEVLADTDEEPEPVPSFAGEERP